MVRVHIQWQDIHGRWHAYQTKHNERDAYRTAKHRTSTTGKRHRIVDDDGRIIDLIDT